MIRFYSLFVTDDHALTSPFTQRFNVFHDLTLHRGHEETVNFLLQSPLSEKQVEQLQIIYDPQVLHVNKIDIKRFKHQTWLTATVLPEQLGSIRIGFAFPQTERLYRARMQSIPSPMTAVPAKSLIPEEELAEAHVY